MNDSVDGLYLATHLWSKTLANMVNRQGAALPILLHVKLDELRDDLRSRFGHIRREDVKRALDLLVTAKLAQRDRDSWYIAWDRLFAVGERVLERIIARRVCRPPATSRVGQLRSHRTRVTRDRRQRDQLELF